MEGTRTIGLRPGMRFGMGVASETEQVRGEAVTYASLADSSSTPRGGQTAQSSLLLVRSQRELLEQLRISTAASVDLAVVSDRDSVHEFARANAAHEFALHLMVRASVLNPPRRMVQPRLTPEAAATLQRDPEEFRRTFGDAYIDEVIGGGEFFGVLVFTARDDTSHELVARDLSRSVGALLAQSQVVDRVRSAVAAASGRAEIRLWSFARGGSGAPNAVDLDGLLARYTDFNTSARDASVDVAVTIKDFRLLPLPPGPSWAEQQLRYDTVATCAQRVVDGLALRHALTFVLTHPEQFVAPDVPALEEARDLVEQRLPQWAQRATACSRDVAQCTLSDLEPVDVRLPDRAVVADPLRNKLDEVLQHDSSAAPWFSPRYLPQERLERYDVDPERGGRWVFGRNAEGAPVSGIFWHPEVDGGRAHVVYGAIFARYHSKGCCLGPLGYPTSDEQAVQRDEPGEGFVLDPPPVQGVDRRSSFEHGRIYWTARTGEVREPVWVPPHVDLPAGLKGPFG